MLWMVMMLLILISFEQLAIGRGHNIEHLGGGAGQVRQVELQVLRWDWLIMEEMQISLQLLIIWWPGTLKWAQGSGSLPTPSGKTSAQKCTFSIPHLLRHHHGNLEQGGHPGSDREGGEGGGRDLHCQRLPHQVRQPQGFDQIPTKPIKCHNFRWGWGRSRQTWREGLRWELFFISLNFCKDFGCLFHFLSGESLPSHARPQHRAGAHQHQGIHSTFYFWR